MPWPRGQGEWERSRDSFRPWLPPAFDRAFALFGRHAATCDQIREYSDRRCMTYIASNDFRNGVALSSRSGVAFTPDRRARSRLLHAHISLPVVVSLLISADDDAVFVEAAD